MNMAESSRLSELNNCNPPDKIARDNQAETRPAIFADDAHQTANMETIADTGKHRGAEALKLCRCDGTAQPILVGRNIKQ